MKLPPLEACLENIPNIFNLILVATRRARQIAYGKTPKVHFDKDEDVDSPTSIALREIGEKLVSSEILHEELPTSKEVNNLGFSRPGPLPPLSALSRLAQQSSKEDGEDSDLRNLDDFELGLAPTSNLHRES